MGRFVKAGIEIGEMKANDFSGGKRDEDKQQPSPEKLQAIGADINRKLRQRLGKYDLTVKEYGQRSLKVFAHAVAMKGYLSEHPDLQKRYEALPFDRRGRGDSSRGIDAGLLT